MKTLAPQALALALAVLATGAFAKDKPMAPDNTLTPAEKAAGWKLLLSNLDPRHTFLELVGVK